MVGDDISKKDLAAFWWADPVHLTPLGYEKLGEQLSDKVAANKRLSLCKQAQGLVSAWPCSRVLMSTFHIPRGECPGVCVCACPIPQQADGWVEK